MLVDQYRLRRRLQKAFSRRSKTAKNRQASSAEVQPVDDAFFAQISQQIERSVEQRRCREAQRPALVYPDELPIVQRRQEIARAIHENQVVIIAGETGSGKTTQLPKICLELGRGVAGLIGHTQPRRIAARSVAHRIAHEIGSPLGQHVGYKVRFNHTLHQSAYIKLMTDGILLAETQHDPLLLQYDTIIIDEAHERSLNIDFLLGYLKQLLPKRPDLKIIITSATIDPERFSRHFNNAPILEVTGRTYPVTIEYRPVQSEEPDEEDPTMLDAIVAAVEEILNTPEQGQADAHAAGEPARNGDILIFLSGEREIRETAEALKTLQSRHHKTQHKNAARASATAADSQASLEILPLYARLSPQEQQRIFQPHSGRRIVLATNVAETSLTVPGIRYVIDPGFARISRYSANARVQRLPIEPISQASANQRAGRCGRIEAGKCIRLYSEDDYESRPLFTDPEILRANLASVILQMKALKLGAVEKFPFIDPPRPAMIREGYQTLLELGAVNENHHITPLGLELAKLPVDPRIGRMILAAKHERCLREVLIIASALAMQDPRLRPMDAQEQADEAHQQFADDTSDFLSYLKLWNAYHDRAAQLSSSKLRQWCQQHYISYLRMREWYDIHAQLHDLTKELKLRLNRQPARSESIHRALLTGLLGHVGFKADGREYTGPRDRKFHIFPGSGLFKKGPKWIMAAELVQTNRLYARTVARVQPEWIERLAPHLIKRTYSEPHWNRKSAHVEAYEKITLQGLIIVPRRRVHFGPINPQHAREIFIQNALVEGEYDTSAPFFAHNRELIERVRTLEAKIRRRDVMVDPEVIFDFYDRHIPEGVFNGPLFEKWRKQAEADDPKLLFMSRDDLMLYGAEAITAEQFPDSIELHGISLPLEYQLNPGQPDDGVTMIVPLEVLNLIREEQTQWLVPGLLREKIVALIKTLPKYLRRNFVPAPEYADICLQMIEFGRGSLLEELSNALHRRTGVKIPHTPGEAWRPDALPDYLRMNFKVVDAKGEPIASGRDLSQLKQKVARKAEKQKADSSLPGFERDHILDWDFDELPDRIEIQRAGITLFAYPAIIDNSHSVSIRLMDSPEAAARATRAGIRRLFALQVHDELSMHIEYLPNIEEMCLQFAPLGESETLRRALADLVVDRVFIGDLPVVSNAKEFQRRLRSGWINLWPVAGEVSTLVSRILTAHHDVDLRLADADSPFWAESIADIRTQLRHLFQNNFLLDTPFEWLQQYPRYLQAIQIRLHRLANAGLSRDRQATEEIARHWQRYAERLQQHRLHNVLDPTLEQYRWMIEELRVSLFAQELRTRVPVSSKRLDKLWEQVRI